jgi:3-phosphoshikimate 1-carboxyvinyltransferase
LTNDQYAPITIQNNQQLTAIDYHSPIASAQVKSCLLLAGLYAQGETTIVEPAATRDHTEIMLAEFGVHTKKRNRQISIKGGKELVATSITIPGDMSSAAFFIVAATLIPNSNLIIKNVGINPTRIGCIHLLMQMGANIKLFNQRQINGEAIADIKIQHALLQGIEIGQDQISAAIDEFPILFIAAACAEGQTILHGASELRVKESDRIHAMAAGLKILGIHCEEFADGMVITGGTLQGGCVDSHGDHRVAMAFSIAACVAKDAVTVENCQNIETSFPGFVELARSIGMIISVDE